MSVQETLRRAISLKECVRIRVNGAPRLICPHALGLKDGRPRVLAFQYEGASVSGLAAGGQWRAFFVHDLQDAVIVAGAWQTAHNFVAKSEACLDRIEYRVHG
jgi:hypothetical protein